MGSLMAGWDSPVLDHKSVKYKRNWSFTKEEIDAYWKLKKKTEEEHLKAISTPSESINQDGTYDDYGVKLQRSSSLPEAKRKESLMGMETDKSLEEVIKKNGWWKRSNWAFLNEPPVLERSSNTYAAQFHIANLADSKHNNTGISA
ncbi:hypothetical protein P3X46_020871 [Hevea brasiliensis]|uniref:Uncharacterized protein n=1 Tax=Hevea brasiliensis TaxID=3981 RepID=A0ABQ9LDT7_HEVBR|nr:uncharacterized protein LOC110655321 [Hevea brasiliensis]KAJ9166072.1 hypothetical protein P3X46_020871 [Hevea brasiliensis]